MPSKRWLNHERLTEWLGREKVFEIIFGDSIHSEVVKKSNSLLSFLYSVGKIQTNEIDIIWDCAINKHEAYKAAILKALTNLSSKLSIDHLKYLLHKIKSLSF